MTHALTDVKIYWIFHVPPKLRLFTVPKTQRNDLMT